MKIKFIKPLPQVDHVIPIGHVLDAHPGFAQKMIRHHYAVLVDVPVVTEVKTPVAEKPAQEAPVKTEPAMTPFELALKAAHQETTEEAKPDEAKPEVKAEPAEETAEVAEKPAQKKRTRTVTRGK